MTNRVPRRRGIAAITTATALWGIAGGLVAGIDVNGFAAAGLLELITGILLTIIGLITGISLRATIRRLGYWLPLLAIAEALNAALYFAALHMAPVGIVMAVHLMSPVILSVIAMITGTRPVKRVQFITIALIIIALALLAVSHTGGNHNAIALGVILSFLSAICIAIFITIVAKVTPDSSPMLGAGLQMLASGLMLSPFIFWINGTDDIVDLAVIAVLFFAPAPWLYWKALRDVSPIHAGTIQLFEPVFGSIAAAIAFGLGIRALDGIAALCVIMACWLEATIKLRSANVGTSNA